MFSKYEILDVIGQGGTGTVYLAEHITLGVKRAVKLIEKNQTSSESFFYEANILKNLKYPGIPIIYDIEEDNQFYYIIEEYVEGTSLEQYLQEYPELSQHERINIVRQLCKLVGYLHELTPHPIIHLDIKPQNIIMSGRQVYLIDYGNGHIMNAGLRRQYCYGTEGYAAPEQYNGTEPNTMSDMYALAKVITLILGNVIDDRLAEMLNICLRRTNKDRHIGAMDIYNYLGGNDLEKKKSCEIYVMGTQCRIGVTHLCLAIVSSLNRRGMKALYIDYNNHALPDIMSECEFKLDKKGIARIQNCRVLPHYDRANDVEEDGVVRIIDKGVISDFSDKAGRNIILICGGREWEKSVANSSMTRYELGKSNNILVLFNCGKENAVPYIRNPFRTSFCENVALRKVLRNIRKWKDDEK